MLGQSLGGLRPSLGKSLPWQPVVTQSGALAGVGTAQYQRIGNLVFAWGRPNVLDATGAVAANDVVISLPVPAVNTTPFYSCNGAIFDASASVIFEGMARLISATTFKLQTVHANGAGTGVSTAGNTFLGSIDFTAALAAGDFIDFYIIYEGA